MSDNQNNIDDQQENQIDYDTYLSFRQNLDAAELEVSGRYDKWILTLSGGALGLSITFLEKIATAPPKWSFWILGAAWIFYVISLMSALLSFLTSQSAIRDIRNQIDSNWDEQKKRSVNQKKIFKTLTNVLNWGSMALFVFGTVLLCVFSLINIYSKEQINVGEKEPKSIAATQAIERRLCATDITTWLCSPCGTKIKATIEPKPREEELIPEKGAGDMADKNNNKESTKKGYVPPSEPKPNQKPKDDQNKNKK